MRRQVKRLASAALVALAIVAGGSAATAVSVADAAPLTGVTAQYPDLHGGGTVTLGGPGYAHGYGDTNRGYGNLPGHGAYVSSYGNYNPQPEPFAPTTAPGAIYAPPQYYHQFHPGAAHGCPGVFPC